MLENNLLDVTHCKNFCFRVIFVIEYCGFTKVSLPWNDFPKGENIMVSRGVTCQMSHRPWSRNLRAFEP